MKHWVNYSRWRYEHISDILWQLSDDVDVRLEDVLEITSQLDWWYATEAFYAKKQGWD